MQVVGDKTQMSARSSEKLKCVSHHMTSNSKAAAAQKLARLASELPATVGQFKYGEEEQTAKPAAKMKEQMPKAPGSNPPPAYRSAHSTTPALQYLSKAFSALDGEKL